MTGAVHGVIASTPNGAVTLSGETGIHGTGDIGTGFIANAAIVVRADGTIDKIETGVGTTQIDSATDWIIPNSAASSAYEVMIHEDSGTLNRSGQDAIDTWVALDQDREWGVLYSSPTPGSKTCTATLSIRKNGGPVIDTAVYTVTAQVV